MPGHGGPALVVDAAIADHLEVLRLSAFRCLRIVEAVVHTYALHRYLRDAVDHVRLGQLRRVENRRCYVDDMVKLMPGLAFGLNALWPMDNCTVAGAAPVRRDLLGPLIRGVHRVRPADRVVIVRFGTAEFVDTSGQKGGGLKRSKAIEGEHFIEATLQSAFARGSVVADNVIDQRIIEHL